MRHYKKKGLCALVLFILILYACVDEASWIPETGDNAISVKEAECYFNEHVQSFFLCGGEQTRNADEALLVTPLWEKGKTVRFRKQPLVEVPVYAPMTITKSLDAMQDDSARHVNTLYNLLAEKGEDGTILFTIAKVTCEIGCLKKIRGRRLTFHIGYDNLKEFSGTIRYYNLEGEFLTGFDYRNGIRTAVIETSKPYDPDKGTASKQKATKGGYEHCRTELIAEDVYYCYDVFVGNELMKNECEYSHTYYYEEEHCEWIDTGEDDDSGGGGGRGNDDNKKTPPDDPCKAAENLRNDYALRTRMLEYAQKVWHKSQYENLEDGWLKISNGEILGPTKREEKSASFSGHLSRLQQEDLKINEFYHTHMNGGSQFSKGDFKSLASYYRNNFIDPDNFVFGMIMLEGSSAIVISNESQFKEFANKIENNFGSFTEEYDAAMHEPDLGMDELRASLINLLERWDSGLTILHVEAILEEETFDWNNFKPLEVRDNILTTKNCQ